MPTPPPFPSIPVATTEPASLLDTVNALKQAVELLTGQATDTTKSAMHVFVQADEPTAIRTGDLWLCTGSTYTFNIWDGSRWLKAGPPLPITTEEADTFRMEQFNKAVRR